MTRAMVSPRGRTRTDRWGRGDGWMDDDEEDVEEDDEEGGDGGDGGGARVGLGPRVGVRA